MFTDIPVILTVYSTPWVLFRNTRVTIPPKSKRKTKTALQFLQSLNYKNREKVLNQTDGILS